MRGSKRSLRAHLKDSTQKVHDDLDSAVSPASWTTPQEYALFLKQQLEARQPIERWADENCPIAIRPPDTAALLVEDLADLGLSCDEATRPAFALPLQSDPIGLAWAIAGSQMGNKVILAKLKKANSPEAQLPVRFLSDPRMGPFWRSILPYLEKEMTLEQAQPAIMAALSVFARFRDAFAPHQLESDAA